MNPQSPSIADDDHDEQIRLGGRSLRRTAAIAIGVAIVVAGSASGARAATVHAGVSWGARSPGVGSLSGLGEVTPPGCDDGAYKVAFASVSDPRGSFIVARPAAIGVSCPAVTYGTTTMFRGSWDARTGGCVDDVNGTGGRLCVGAMPDRGIANGVPFRLCPDRDRCFVGSAWIVRV